PGEPDADRVNEIIRRMNQEPSYTSSNHRAPVLPPNVKPRPSGWKCPRCGLVAEQRVDPAPGSILGYTWVTEEDGKPSPVSVITEEVLERNEDGSPKKTYKIRHCFNCFNIWQRRKLMEEIRANVPQLNW